MLIDLQRKSPASNRALIESSGHGIAASTLEIAIDDSEWKHFPEQRPQAGSSGLLLETLVLSKYGRRSHQATRIRVRCAEGAAIPGEYYGPMDVRAIIY